MLYICSEIFTESDTLKMKRLFVLSVCFISLTMSYAHIADTAALIHFRFDDYRIDAAYMENAGSLANLDSLLQRLDVSSVDSVVVIAGASPEGVYEHNLYLAGKRVQSVEAYLVGSHPEWNEKILCRSLGENWPALRICLLQDKSLSEEMRQKVLAVLDADVNVGTKKWRLQQLDVYPFLYEKYYRRLRHAAVCLVYRRQTEMLPAGPLASLEVTSADSSEWPGVSADSSELSGASADSSGLVLSELRIPQRAVQSWRESREIFYLSSNLLCPLANVGVDVALGNTWSMGLGYSYPWLWRAADHKHCFQLLSWAVDAHYWFGAERPRNSRSSHASRASRTSRNSRSCRSYEDRLEGHSVGMSASFGYYDFERNYQGWQGEFAALAADYRYAWPIFDDRLHLQFSLSFAYLYSVARPYDVPERGGKAYKRNYTQRLHYLGPNAVELSLVLPVKWKLESR